MKIPPTHVNCPGCWARLTVSISLGPLKRAGRTSEVHVPVIATVQPHTCPGGGLPVAA